MHCELCGGELTLLGRLAQLFWFRCRRCGMEQSQSTDEAGLDLQLQEA